MKPRVLFLIHLQQYQTDHESSHSSLSAWDQLSRCFMKFPSRSICITGFAGPPNFSWVMVFPAIHVSYAWRLLYHFVHRSILLNLLSSLIQFLWFTKAFQFSIGIKANANSLWTYLVFVFQSMIKFLTIYPCLSTFVLTLCHFISQKPLLLAHAFFLLHTYQHLDIA